MQRYLSAKGPYAPVLVYESIPHSRDSGFSAPPGRYRRKRCLGANKNAAGRKTCFNPRAPRGARLVLSRNTVFGPGFQSTRPARGATPPKAAIPLPVVGFNPRAPRGARRHGPGSIAAPDMFQSTRPARGATWSSRAIRSSVPGFNPRAPRGARHTRADRRVQLLAFQSTRPARGATQPWMAFDPGNKVSIHAPRAGRDRADPCTPGGIVGFNPRAPRGARLHSLISALLISGFNPRAPRGARPELES